MSFQDVGKKYKTNILGIFFYIFFANGVLFAQSLPNPSVGVNRTVYGYYNGQSTLSYSNNGFSYLKWSSLTHIVDFSFTLNAAADGTLTGTPRTSLIQSAVQNNVRPIMGVICVGKTAPGILDAVLNNSAAVNTLITSILNDISLD